MVVGSGLAVEEEEEVLIFSRLKSFGQTEVEVFKEIRGVSLIIKGRLVSRHHSYQLAP